MTTQQENYIESELDRYYLKRKDEYLDYIEDRILNEVELEEEDEADRCRHELHGAALESHLKKFCKDKEKELYEYHMDEFEKEIAEELEKYRKELEASCE